MREKLRTRILRSDPRSASDGVDRTPIAFSKQGGSGKTGETAVTSTALEMETPEVIQNHSLYLPLIAKLSILFY